MVPFFIGTFVRLTQYFFNRSLWYDELMLVLSIIDKPLFQLGGPNTYNQVAPIGFLVLTKLLTLYFGSGEYVLRFIPLICGALSIILIFKVIKPYSRSAAILSAFFLAICLPPIQYSVTYKPYSSDLMFGLLLYLFVPKLLEEKFNRKTYIGFAVVSSIAIWFSFPVIFVLASIGIVLFIQSIHLKRYTHLKGIIMIGLFWIINFVPFYMLSMAPGFENSSASSYFQKFMLGHIYQHSVVDLGKRLLNVFQTPIGLYPKIAAPFFVIGVVKLWRRNKFQLVLFGLPILLCIAASVLQRYPFVERLVLFLVPFFLYFIMEGILLFFELPWKVYRVVGCLALVAISILPVRETSKFFTVGFRVEETRPYLDMLRHNYRNGDLVYIYYGAIPAFKYYAPRYNLSNINYVFGVSSRDNFDGYKKDIEMLKNSERVWVLFSHIYLDSKLGTDKDYILEQMSRFNRGRYVDTFFGASLYLFE